MLCSKFYEVIIEFEITHHKVNFIAGAVTPPLIIQWIGAKLCTISSSCFALSPIATNIVGDLRN